MIVARIIVSMCSLNSLIKKYFFLLYYYFLI